MSQLNNQLYASIKFRQQHKQRKKIQKRKKHAAQLNLAALVIMISFGYELFSAVIFIVVHR